jgi:hypothetical protein
MNTVETIKGYDDSAYLQEMAGGIITRRFNSVDEAAKAVLGEDSGSNVDRLRRKYREQNWHEKGLASYVEAEIAKRNLITAPGHMMLLAQMKAAIASPAATASNSIIKAKRLLGRTKPDGKTAIPMVVATLLLTGVSLSAIPLVYAMAAFLAFTLYSLTSWADRSGENSDGRTAGFVMSSIAAGIAALVGVFGAMSPSSAYSTGSMHGAITLAIGMSIIGVYATSFVSTRAIRVGRRKTFEVSALIVAIAAFSQIGTVIMAKEAGVFAYLQTALQAVR